MCIRIYFNDHHWCLFVDKNKNRKGLSASEYFSNAVITDLTDKEFKKIK